MSLVTLLIGARALTPLFDLERSRSIQERTKAESTVGRLNPSGETNLEHNETKNSPKCCPLEGFIRNMLRACNLVAERVYPPGYGGSLGCSNSPN